MARYGDAVPRFRYFTIEQFLERAVDYAIDWTYFSKDEDVSDTSTIRHGYCGIEIKPMLIMALLTTNICMLKIMSSMR